MSPLLLQELLKLVWTGRLYDGPAALATREGQSVTVIDPGQINPEEGPAVVGALIEIDGVRHSGPVAIHTQASEWRRQLRHIDMRHDACILHVVLDDDTAVCRLDGSAIPTVTITYPPALDELYAFLTAGHGKCGRVLAGMERINRMQFLTRLMIERLERKYNDFLALYAESGNNWNEVFYVMLFRTMGAGKNREAYTKLAKLVTYSNLCRVKESTAAIEGVLLGAAGLLDTERGGRFADSYTVRLQEEADHLCRRFSIRPMQPREWDIRRNNPNNHPVIRIVQLAALLASKEFLFSQLIECTAPDEVRKILSAEASEYWCTHYLPSRRSEFSEKRIGRMMQDILIINLVVPMIFTYGKVNGNETMQERALDLLEQVDAEGNKYIRDWCKAGIEVENAFFSQALLQLSREYCEKKRCASCNLGKILLCSHEKELSLAPVL